MTRDEVADLRFHLENFANTANVQLENTMADERDLIPMEVQDHAQHWGDLDDFRARMKAKYGI